MALNTEDLQNLLEEHKLTLADIEFIVKYMASENISPQLAMRRIKSFEQLKEKLEDTKEKDRIAELETQVGELLNELNTTKKTLDDLMDAKSGLEHEKQELESKSEILDSERDELQRQLQMLQQMQLEEEDEEEILIEKLTANIEELALTLQEVTTKVPKATAALMAVVQALQSIQENQTLGELTVEGLSQEVQALVSGTSTTPATIKDDSRLGWDDDDDELVKPSQRATFTKSTTAKSIKAKTKSISSKEKKKADSLMEKTRQVLNLFTEFISEADDDSSFQDRVSTICDMDEAYAYLGSIGLSQVYSFATKGVKKKSELLKLLESWKKDGVPR